MNDLLDERITANEKYRDRYADEAAESPYAKELKPLEKRIGQEWVDYLRYVRKSDDAIQKIHVLRLELLDEVRGCYYDLEFEDGVMAKGRIRLEMKKWKQKVEQVDALAKELLGEQEKGSE